MDDVVLQKVESIERCVKRVKEEYQKSDSDFEQDYTRQDAAILNLQRACEQSIDLANYVIKKEKLGMPTYSRESFEILQRNGIISEELAGSLTNMVGFRNLAVHEYASLDIKLINKIIEDHLEDFLDFTRKMLNS
jgi:uncharacterized protein YutE (UPF0331/DUF86 family)